MTRAEVDVMVLLSALLGANATAGVLSIPLGFGWEFLVAHGVVVVLLLYRLHVRYQRQGWHA